LQLQAARAKINGDGEDVSVVGASVVDSMGWVVPAADKLISFQLSGAGRLIGVVNGDPSSHEVTPRPHDFGPADVDVKKVVIDPCTSAALLRFLLAC
jgi:hypothetical protein